MTSLRNKIKSWQITRRFNKHVLGLDKLKEFLNDANEDIDYIKTKEWIADEIKYLGFIMGLRLLAN